MTFAIPRRRCARHGPVVLVLGLALALAACGSPDDDADPVAVADTASSATPAATSPSPIASPIPTVAPSPPPSPTPSPASPTPSPTPSPTRSPLPAKDLPTGVVPVRIEIPSIDLDADVGDLAIGPGDPEVPEAWEDAGWYTTTRNPGEFGPAVIAGHIDSKAGPAVFHRLDELTEGDEVIVHGQDGESRTFTVRDSGQYPKTSLPDEVFGFGQARPELRLITCGGSFDSTAGHYVDNLVVYAASPP
jgi:sortase (surface protein transpeptidase)